MKILLADDERTIAVTLGDALRAAGHDVTVVPDGEGALKTLQGGAYDCVITDLRMPKADGLAVTRAAKQASPDTWVILITAYGGGELGFQAAKEGVDEFLQKPFYNDQVLHMLAKLERLRLLKEENEKLKRELGGPQRFGRLIGKSKGMLAVYQQISAVAPSDCSVLIEGESGTGKEQIARQIHATSPRKDGPFEVISVSLFPDTLIDDALFGHVKGAFTDARSDRAGKFEAAAGGTIFIDDVDDMPVQTQVKLLRVLQERQVERLGDTKSVRVDVRVIAATKVNLWELARQQKFREDLFHRLNVAHIAAPPLRDRDGDLPLLIRHFVERYGKGAAYEVPSEALEALGRYAWPGNVRELEHSVERAIAYAGPDRVLRKEHLLKPLISASDGGGGGKLTTLREASAEAEARHIRNVLAHTGNHKGEAARILGITRKNLWEKMREYAIEG